MYRIAPESETSRRKQPARFQTTVWPNGEAVISRKRQARAIAPSQSTVTKTHIAEAAMITAVWPVLGTAILRLPAAGGSYLGLFHLRNSDSASEGRARYGLKGITTKGRRTVRNACYLLQRDYNDKHLTFSTVTLPSLSEDDMSVLHQKWHHLVELYRLKMGRKLRAKGLPGQLVGVTEIQEKRWARSGAPVLHCHFVFVGRARRKGWAISTTEHDLLWSQAIETVLGKPIGNAHAACQLKRVDGRPDTYLGKYVSKGASVVEKVKEAGLEAWLPRQWWNCSRRLTRKIEKEKACFEDGSKQVLALGEEGNAVVWQWYRDFVVDFDDSESMFMARYGTLTQAGKRWVMRAAPT